MSEPGAGPEPEPPVRKVKKTLDITVDVYDTRDGRLQSSQAAMALRGSQAAWASLRVGEHGSILEGEEPGPSVLIGGAVDEELDLVAVASEVGGTGGGGSGIGAGGAARPGEEGSTLATRVIDVDPAFIRPDYHARWLGFVTKAVPPWEQEGSLLTRPARRAAGTLSHTRSLQLQAKLRHETGATRDADATLSGGGWRVAVDGKKGQPLAGAFGGARRAAYKKPPEGLLAEAHEEAQRQQRGGGRDHGAGNGHGARAHNGGVAPRSADVRTHLQNLKRNAESHSAYIPQASGPAEQRAMENELEHLRQWAAVQSSSEPSKRMELVWLRWSESGRLTVPEAKLLFEDMFLKAAAAGEVRELVALWHDMLREGVEQRDRGHGPFLDLERMALVPFWSVFLASRAFELVLAAYLRDAESVGERDFKRLSEMCLDRRAPLKLIDTLAGKVARPVRAPSILVSAASLNVQPASMLIGDFTALAKDGAELADVHFDVNRQIIKLDNMLALREALVAQALTCLDYFGHMDDKDTSEGGAIAGELETLSFLQQYCVPMQDVYQLRHHLATQAYVSTKAADELYMELNGIKARLLGPRCRPFELPDLDEKELAALGVRKETGRYRSYFERAVQTAGRKVQQVLAGEGDLPLEEEEDDDWDMYEFKVRIVSANIKTSKRRTARLALKARGTVRVSSLSSTKLETRTAKDAPPNGVVRWPEGAESDWVEVEGRAMRGAKVTFALVHDRLLGGVLGEVKVDLKDFEEKSEDNLHNYELRPAPLGSFLLEGSTILAGVSLRKKGKMADVVDAHNQVHETARISGSWTGYFEHEKSRQLGTMQLVFSQTGLGPVRISGIGKDEVGQFKIAGRAEDSTATTLAWTKVYVQPYTPGYLPPAVAFRGERRGEVISGKWAAAYDARATFHFSPASGRAEWSSQECLPLSEKVLAVSLALPDHWEKRLELLRLVADKMGARTTRDADELADEDWVDVFLDIAPGDELMRAFRDDLRAEADSASGADPLASLPSTPARSSSRVRWAPGADGGGGAGAEPATPPPGAGHSSSVYGDWDGDGEVDEDDTHFLRLAGARNVRTLRRLYHLAAAAQPRIDFAEDLSVLSHEDRERGLFTSAQVRQPLVPTGGSFVMWLDELPAHQVYPKIVAYLPEITLPAEGAVPRAAARLAGDDSEGARAQQRALYATKLASAQRSAHLSEAFAAEVSLAYLEEFAIRLKKGFAFVPRQAKFEKEAREAAETTTKAIVAALRQVSKHLAEPMAVCVEGWVSVADGAPAVSVVHGRGRGSAGVMTANQLKDLARRRAEYVRDLVRKRLADGPAEWKGSLTFKGFAGSSGEGGIVLRVLTPEVSGAPGEPSSPRLAGSGPSPPPTPPRRDGGPGDAASDTERILILELAQLEAKLGAELDLRDCFMTVAFAAVDTPDEELFVTKLAVPREEGGAGAGTRAVRTTHNGVPLQVASAMDAADPRFGRAPPPAAAGGAGSSSAAAAAAVGARKVRWDERLVLRVSEAAFQNPERCVLKVEVHRRRANDIGGPPYLPLELNDVLQRSMREALAVAAEVRREHLASRSASTPQELAAHRRRKDKGHFRVDGPLASALDPEVDGVQNGMPTDPIGRCWVRLDELLLAQRKREAAVNAGAHDGGGSDADAAATEVERMLKAQLEDARSKEKFFDVADRTVVAKDFEMPLVELMHLSGATEEIAQVIHPLALDRADSSEQRADAAGGFVAAADAGMVEVRKERKEPKRGAAAAAAGAAAQSGVVAVPERVQDLSGWRRCVASLLLNPARERAEQHNSVAGVVSARDRAVQLRSNPQDTLRRILPSQLAAVSVPVGLVQFSAGYVQWRTAAARARDAALAGAPAAADADADAAEAVTVGIGRATMAAADRSSRQSSVAAGAFLKDKFDVEPHDLEALLTEDPYSAERPHVFLKYQWEAAEEAELEPKLAELQQHAEGELRAYHALLRQLRLVQSRVVGRQTEHLYAQKRSAELRLLSQMEQFGAQWLRERAQVLSAAAAPLEGGGESMRAGRLSAEDGPGAAAAPASGHKLSTPLGFTTPWSAVGFPDREQVRAAKKEPLPPEVASMVDVVKLVFEKQQELVRTWRPLVLALRAEAIRARYPRVFAKAHRDDSGGDSSFKKKAYANKAQQLRARQQEAARGALAAPRDAAPREDQQRQVMSAADVEQLYNGVLRKLWSSREVLRYAIDALRNFLPPLPKWLDVADGVAILPLFQHWKEVDGVRYRGFPDKHTMSSSDKPGGYCATAEGAEALTAVRAWLRYDGRGRSAREARAKLMSMQHRAKEASKQAVPARGVPPRPERRAAATAYVVAAPRRSKHESVAVAVDRNYLRPVDMDYWLKMLYEHNGAVWRPSPTEWTEKSLDDGTSTKAMSTRTADPEDGKTRVRDIEQVLAGARELLTSVNALMHEELPPEDVTVVNTPTLPGGQQRFFEYELVIDSQPKGTMDSLMLLLHTRIFYAQGEKEDLVRDLLSWDPKLEDFPPYMFELTRRAPVSVRYDKSKRDGRTVPGPFRERAKEYFLIRTEEPLRDLTGISLALPDDESRDTRVRVKYARLTSRTDQQAWHFELPPQAVDGRKVDPRNVGLDWVRMPMRPLYVINVTTGFPPDGSGSVHRGAVHLRLEGNDGTRRTQDYRLEPGGYERFDASEPLKFEVLLDWYQDGTDGQVPVPPEALLDDSLGQVVVRSEASHPTWGPTWFLDTVSVWCRHLNTQAYFPHFDWVQPGQEHALYARPKHLVQPPPAPAAPFIRGNDPAYATRLRISFHEDAERERIDKERPSAPEWVLQWRPEDPDTSVDGVASRDLPHLPFEVPLASLGLDPNVRYHFRLAGKNLAGTGAFSNPVTLLAAPLASAAAEARARNAAGGFTRGRGLAIMSPFGAAAPTDPRFASGLEIRVEEGAGGERSHPRVSHAHTYTTRVLALTSRRMRSLGTGRADDPPAEAAPERDAHRPGAAAAAAAGVVAKPAGAGLGRSRGGMDEVVSAFENRVVALGEGAHSGGGKVPGVPVGQAPPAVVTVGQAEVLDNVLRLTPLAKGVGQRGAAWLNEPVNVRAGFEVIFRVKVTAPVDLDGTPAQPADGFAFVMHRDPRLRAALGGSGTQLGYGGMENVIAVQFGVQPSCAREHPKDPAKQLGLDDDEKILCQKKSDSRNYFWVRKGDLGKRVYNPFNTSEVITAPKLENLTMNTLFTANKSRARGADDFDPSDEDVDELLRHRVNAISVQTDGVRPVSTAPVHSRGHASLSEYDIDLGDGKEHQIRIVFEPSRFATKSAEHSVMSSDYWRREWDWHSQSAGDAERHEPKKKRSKITRSHHHLSVYVDDNFRAKLSIQVDLNDWLSDVEHWDGHMIAGLTASTGRLYAEHAITSWELYQAKDRLDTYSRPTC